ncbi:MAG: hypothetical protein K2L21_07665 [Muribaculaceae bacterium]|nr:hypothetical protein [Muribaculaceae bacterium]
MALVLLMPLAITTLGETPLEAGRDLIVRYGVNPYYETLNSVRCPDKDAEGADVGAGWGITLPDGETYAVTVADESFIRKVAQRRLSLREEFSQLNYPVKIDGAGMTLQYAYFDDETASSVYFYVCDESIHDMNQKMREGDLTKMLLGKSLMNETAALSAVAAYANIKYIYIGNKTGLTSYITFYLHELHDFVTED